MNVVTKYFILLLSVGLSSCGNPLSPLNQNEAAHALLSIDSGGQPGIPEESPNSAPPSYTFPAQILNLSYWEVTLPLGPIGNPTDIYQPMLASYSIDPWFIANPTCDAVQFRAPTSGVTTKGSVYPRTELREMNSAGTLFASWSTTSGTHTMFIDEAITAVPVGKKEIVAGQIHDSVSDVIVIRLDYPTLYIKINNTKGPTLDADYVLGRRFTVRFVASGSRISIYYNGSATPVYSMSKSDSGCYFKAGAYTQSNCSTESSHGATCGPDNYGEVQIYNLWVTHS